MWILVEIVKENLRNCETRFLSNSYKRPFFVNTPFENRFQTTICLFNLVQTPLFVFELT